MAEAKTGKGGAKGTGKPAGKDAGKDTAKGAPKAAANLPSRRISESSGMRVIKTKDLDYVSGRHPSEIWEITREEWRQRSG